MENKQTEKLHTVESITALLLRNDKAVDRAIIRLYNDLPFLYQRYRNETDYNFYVEQRIKNFAWFVLGQDDKGNVRWEPKSLAHPIADRQLKKFIPYANKGKKCIDAARDLAIMFIDHIVNIANNQFEKDGDLLDSMSLPEHISLGTTSQRRYGDRYSYDMYLKSAGKELPESQFPTSYEIENKRINEVVEIQSAWRRFGKYPELSNVDPRHIIERYDFWKTTHIYLD